MADTKTSFGAELDALTSTIAARAGESPDTSYTALLLSKGALHCARKIGEEAIELVQAMTLEDKTQTCAEAADLLYHILVGLAAADIDVDEVANALHRRRRQSGLAEKAARSGSA